MDSREKWRRGAAWYLQIQAFAVLVWWTGLLSDPEFALSFVGPRLPVRALRAYLLPDIALYVIGGLITAFLLQRNRAGGWPCLLVLAGGILYATLSTFALVLESQGGWIGIPLMTASCAITAFFAWRLRPV
jgi:hypothetical protein